jgi:NTE family protein
MKTFALALGGGGARGLAHIIVLEALDELHVKPAAIAGTSIGAAIGAAYSAGMSGRAIRRYVVTRVHNRADVFARLIRARATAFADMFGAGFGNPMVLDAEKFCTAFLPEVVPDNFSELAIPLTIVAADLYRRSEATFETGPLRAAIAASMAVPGLLRPVEIDGQILVDGAAVNPLPFEHLRGKADVVVAVDSTVGPLEPRGMPDAWEALFTTLQVMSHTIITEKLKHGAPDLMVRPNVGSFRMLDFLRASAILRAADAIKDDVKQRLMVLIGD